MRLNPAAYFLHRSFLNAAGALLLAVGAFRSAGAQNPGLLTGTVTAKETGAPLEHAMITMQTAQRQTFTSDSGKFTVAALAPGAYRMRVTHLGYVPLEIPVTVMAGSALEQLKIELTHITVHIAEMNVRGNWDCANPGAPDPALDPDLAQVIVQLKLNAEHFRLLSDSFPYAYTFRRIRSATDGANVKRLLQIDSVRIVSRGGNWDYHPGQVVGKELGVYVLYIPGLPQFASDEFLKWHCYRLNGREKINGAEILSIDFLPADRLQQPDVSGTIMLDATSYQIVRTSFNMTHPPREIPEMESHKVQTTFHEVSPNIVIISEILGKTTYFKPANWRNPKLLEEDQQLTTFRWLGQQPGRSAPPPNR